MNPSSVRQRFLADGFLAVPGFLNADEVAACLRELNQLIEREVPNLPREHVFYENKEERSTLKQIQRLHEHNPWFGELMNGKPRALAEELLGTEVIPQNMQFFNNV